MAHPKTPKFRVGSSSVFRPGKDLEGNEGSYYVVALFDKDSDLKEMRRLVQEAAKAKFGDKLPPGFKNPLRNQAEKEKDGYVAGNAFITMKNKYNKPQVVGSDPSVLLTPEDFYNGCYAIASYSVHAYDMKASKGVSIRLHNIQKVADGEPLSSQATAADDFEPLEGSNNPDDMFE